MALTRKQIETEAKAFIEKKAVLIADGVKYIDSETLTDFGVFIQVLNNTSEDNRKQVNDNRKN